MLTPERPRSAQDIRDRSLRPAEPEECGPFFREPDICALDVGERVRACMGTHDGPLHGPVGCFDWVACRLDLDRGWRPFRVRRQTKDDRHPPRAAPLLHHEFMANRFVGRQDEDRPLGERRGLTSIGFVVDVPFERCFGGRGRKGPSRRARPKPIIFETIYPKPGRRLWERSNPSPWLLLFSGKIGLTIRTPPAESPSGTATPSERRSPPSDCAR